MPALLPQRIHVATLLAMIVGNGGPSAAAEDAVDQQLSTSVVFEAGEDGYPTYRIPALVVTRSGTLLAFCEARTGGDWSQIDIVSRRSTDGGQSWSPLRKVAEVPGPLTKNPAALRQRSVKAGEVTYNNPLAIVDHETGAVHFLFCLEYARCFYQRSDDDGQTYTKPVEITQTFEKLRDQYPWQVLATGPGHGIQLEGGRLVVPVWLSTATGANVHHPSVITTIYSDDRGHSWQPGAIVTGEREPLVDPNECQAVELADGSVLLNIRSESPPNRRAVAISPDGVSNWSVPSFDPALVDPICMASICRLTKQPAGDRNRLLFSNPANLEVAKGKAAPGTHRERKNLTVRLSYDEGETWAAQRALEPGPSGYSDLAVGPDGMIYCLYERPTAQRKHSLVLARFNLPWLTEGKDWLGR